MILLKNLSFGYNDKILFSGLNAQVYTNKKIGLIGKNGSGKTTLLNILSDNIKEYNGEKIVSGNISIGFLPQEINFLMDELTPFSLCKKAFNDIENKIKKLQELSQKLDNKTYHDEYDKLLNELNENNAFSYEYRIRMVLTSLGLSIDEINTSFSRLSSGFKVRAYLAYLILASPDLLLLDEPTNYLDIDAIQYLVEFLKTYPKSFIIVSHDKNLLDTVVNEIWDLFAQKLYIYPNCNYSSFLVRKNQYLENLEKSAKNIEIKIKQQMEFINRFRAKQSKASSVQSRIKVIEKMQKIEVPKEKTIDFELVSSNNTFTNILSCENLSFGFSNNLLLEKVHFSILRKDRIFLIGRNGIGKTTFLKLLVGQLKPVEGKVVVHNNAKIGYFEQNSSLYESYFKTIYDYFSESLDASNLTETQRKNFLGNFGFTADDVYKELSILSGGEKVRLILSRIFLSRPDILILDEPTTHLDILTKEILIENLKDFNGAILIVSHDIDFTVRLAEKFVTIEDKNLVWLKDIEEYFNKENDKNKDIFKEKEKKTDKKGISTNKRQQIEKKIIELEQQILDIEKKIGEIENKFKQNLPFDTIQQITQEYNLLQKEYEQKFENLIELENSIS